MKTSLLVGLAMVGLALLVAGFGVPVFAHAPEGGEATTANQETWEAMHEACETGDWEAMADAAAEVHGEDFGYMPCHGEGYHPANPGGGMGGHMGGGMMGWR